MRPSESGSRRHATSNVYVDSLLLKLFLNISPYIQECSNGSVAPIPHTHTIPIIPIPIPLLTQVILVAVAGLVGIWKAWVKWGREVVAPFFLELAQLSLCS